VLLRASSEVSGTEVDVRAVGGTAVAESGIPHAETLVALAEAMVGEDDDALARARRDVLDRMDPEALVDAVAVASNFERMIRIADATGIPLDGIVVALSEDLREEIGINRFSSAANTPGAGRLKRAAGRALRPVLFAALRVAGRRRRS